MTYSKDAMGFVLFGWLLGEVNIVLPCLRYSLAAD